MATGSPPDALPHLSARVADILDGRLAAPNGSSTATAALCDRQLQEEMRRLANSVESFHSEVASQNDDLRKQLARDLDRVAQQSVVVIHTVRSTMEASVRDVETGLRGTLQRFDGELRSLGSELRADLCRREAQLQAGLERLDAEHQRLASECRSATSRCEAEVEATFSRLDGFKQSVATEVSSKLARLEDGTAALAAELRAQLHGGFGRLQNEHRSLDKQLSDLRKVSVNENARSVKLEESLHELEQRMGTKTVSQVASTMFGVEQRLSSSLASVEDRISTLELIKANAADTTDARAPSQAPAALVSEFEGRIGDVVDRLAAQVSESTAMQNEQAQRLEQRLNEKIECLSVETRDQFRINSTSWEESFMSVRIQASALEGKFESLQERQNSDAPISRLADFERKTAEFERKMASFCERLVAEAARKEAAHSARLQALELESKLADLAERTQLEEFEGKMATVVGRMVSEVAAVRSALSKLGQGFVEDALERSLCTSTASHTWSVSQNLQHREAPPPAPALPMTNVSSGPSASPRPTAIATRTPSPPRATSPLRQTMHMTSPSATPGVIAAASHKLGTSQGLHESHIHVEIETGGSMLGVVVDAALSIMSINDGPVRRYNAANPGQALHIGDRFVRINRVDVSTQQEYYSALKLERVMKATVVRALPQCQVLQVTGSGASGKIAVVRTYSSSRSVVQSTSQVAAGRTIAHHVGLI